MSARDATKIPRGPGRLFLNPTDLSAATYGGTELGATRAHEYELMDSAPGWVLAEEFRSLPVEGVESGGLWMIFYALMRQADPTALAFLFPNTATGASTGDKVIVGDAAGTIRAGAKLSDRYAKVLFAANDPAHESVILYKALPVVVEGSRVMAEIMKERNIAASFVTIPDASGRLYKIGRLADLSL